MQIVYTKLSYICYNYITYYFVLGDGIMGKRVFFIAVIFLALATVIAFTYDVNSAPISRKQVMSTEVKTHKIEQGLTLEKEIKEGKTFTSSITIPITSYKEVDRHIKKWAIEQEDEFFSEMQAIEPPISQYAEAYFTIEPIVKEVKDRYFTYEMYIQYYVEDKTNQIERYNSKVHTFVIDQEKERFIELLDVIDLPKIKNKSEYTRFLSTIPEGKNKKRLEQIDTKTVEPIQWILTDNNIEFIIENKEKENEVDRVIVEYEKIKDHLHKTYKKQFVPKKKEEKTKKKKQKEKTNKKLVALTFDDGPDVTVTPQILNLLDQYNIKATFFMLARNVNKFPHIAKDVAKQGHEIANHSINHMNLNKAKRSQIEKEIIKSKSIIEKVTGVKPKLFRPPYGEYNNTVIELANKSEQTIVMWSVDTLDWKHRSIKKTLEIINRDTKELSIVLMHDIHQTTADALEKVIETLQKEDYEFVTTSELLKHLDPASNGVYYGK